MDEADIAEKESKAHIAAFMHTLKNKQETDANRLLSLKRHNHKNRCLYCLEEIDNYDSAYCHPEPDWSCRSEHEREQEAEKSGRTLKGF